MQRVEGFDLLDERNFLVAAEPLLDQHLVPRKIVMTAVRKDCEPLARPWLMRLNSAALATSFQSS